MSQDQEKLRIPAMVESIHISAGEATEKQPRKGVNTAELKQLPEREKPLLERQKRVAKQQATARKPRANKLHRWREIKWRNE